MLKFAMRIVTIRVGNIIIKKGVQRSVPSCSSKLRFTNNIPFAVFISYYSFPCLMPDCLIPTRADIQVFVR